MEKHISFGNGYKTSYQSKLDTIKGVGFDGVFFIFECDRNFYEANQYAQKIGLKIDSMHLPYLATNDIWREGEDGDYFTDRLIAGIHYAGSMGIKNAVAHVSSSPTPPMHNDLGLKRLEKVVEVAQKRNVRFCLENTRRNDYLDWVFANFKDADSLGFCFDFGHTNAFTHDTTDPRWLPYLDKLTCVHMHDNDGTGDQHLLPFDGNLNWQYLMPTVFKTRRDVPLTLEFTDIARTLHPYWTEKHFLAEAIDRLSVLEHLIDK